MIDVDDSAVAAQQRRRTWMLGGGLLAASALLTLWAGGAPGLSVGPLPDLLFAAAMVIFAIGLGRAGSVTARRPLGTGALIALAIWLLLSPVLQTLVNQTWMPMDSTPSDDAVSGLIVLNTSFEVIALILAIIAVTQIARAGAVPAPWRWAPLWALLAVAALTVLPSAIAMADPTADQYALVALFGFAGFLIAASIAFLGVLAMILAVRPLPGSTTVYSSEG